MKDDFWTGKLYFTSSIHFDGYGDGEASGSVMSYDFYSGLGRGKGDGKASGFSSDNS